MNFDYVVKKGDVMVDYVCPVCNERLKRDSNRTPIDVTQKRLRRIFNNGSFQQGGRFYGGWWQNIPKLCDNKTFIN